MDSSGGSTPCRKYRGHIGWRVAHRFKGLSTDDRAVFQMSLMTPASPRSLRSVTLFVAFWSRAKPLGAARPEPAAAASNCWAEAVGGCAFAHQYWASATLTTISAAASFGRATAYDCRDTPGARWGCAISMLQCIRRVCRLAPGAGSSRHGQS